MMGMSRSFSTCSKLSPGQKRLAELNTQGRCANVTMPTRPMPLAMLSNSVTVCACFARDSEKGESAGRTLCVSHLASGGRQGMTTSDTNQVGKRVSSQSKMKTVSFAPVNPAGGGPLLLLRLTPPAASAPEFGKTSAAHRGASTTAGGRSVQLHDALSSDTRSPICDISFNPRGTLVLLLAELGELSPVGEPDFCCCWSFETSCTKRSRSPARRLLDCGDRVIARWYGQPNCSGN
mmetsp:Transcript_9461/g.23589  ORF Transcript_9461/g.23589 Transcript_9461/m.23589 type:complete len:235 (-) Transcript_9461:219-923(-)